MQSTFFWMCHWDQCLAFKHSSQSNLISLIRNIIESLWGCHFTETEQVTKQNSSSVVNGWTKIMNFYKITQNRFSFVVLEYFVKIHDPWFGTNQRSALFCSAFLLFLYWYLTASSFVLRPVFTFFSNEIHPAVCVYWYQKLTFGCKRFILRV